MINNKIATISFSLLFACGDSISNKATENSESTSGYSESDFSSGGENKKYCGNKIRENKEECDGEENCFNCVKDRLVFITSEKVRGDFNGNLPIESIGINICNQAAGKAGLLQNPLVYRFRPYIVTSNNNPEDFLYPSEGRYIFTNGEIFANNWEEIIKNKSLNLINVDEYGNIISYIDAVWIGDSNNLNCKNWSYWYDDEYGLVDSLFLGERPINCSQNAYLICFELKEGSF